MEYPRDPTRLDPLKHLLEIKIWGIKQKKQIDKTNEWATWQWVNAKIVENNRIRGEIAHSKPRDHTRM